MLQHLLRALRPRQWTKNLLLFVGVMFTVNQNWRFGEPSMWWALSRASLGFLTFCALASGIYLLNDVRDIEHDRQHPVKQKRPVAAGLVSVPLAVTLGAILLFGGMAASWWLRPVYGAVAIFYVVMQVSYILRLKHVVIVDVFILAMGFVLRAVSGVLLLSAYISPWLYILTFLGALFLGLCKRRHELMLLNERAATHRRALAEYSAQFLDQMIATAAASTIMAYSLYTFTARGFAETHLMMLTIPHVLYGLFRYLYLVYQRGLGGSPEELFLRDRGLWVASLLWVGTAAAVVTLARSPIAAPGTLLIP